MRPRIAALLFMAAAPAMSQTPVISLIGHVRTPESEGVPRVAVSTYSDGLLLGSALSGLNGSYTIRVPRPKNIVVVVARLAGYVTQGTQVAVGPGDSAVSVPDIILIRSAAARSLPAVEVVAGRPKASRDVSGMAAGAGEARTMLDGTSFLTADLTGDASGDPSLALAGIPGLVTTAGADGTSSFSLAGLGADQNRVTVNGADFGGAAPRDAGLLRVSTATYDAAKAASGAQTDMILVSGTFTPVRLLHLTHDSPHLQWTTAATDRLGGRTSLPTLSGRIAGPLSHFATLYSTSFQASRRVNAVSTLATADSATLAAIGVNADSARRLLSSVRTFGIDQGVGGAAQQRVTTTASVYTRLDFTNNAIVRVLPSAAGISQAFPGGGAGRVSYLLLGGNWNESTGLSIGPSALPLHSSASQSAGVTLQAFNSLYLHESILNETRSTVAAQDNRSTPASSLPSATVLMASLAPDGASVLSSVGASGTGGPSAASTLWSWQTTNETRIATANARHELKVALEVTLQHLTTSQGEAGGAYVFNSLADFIARRPASFARSTGADESNIDHVSGAVGFGDTYGASKALSIQYGLRVESHRLRGGGMQAIADPLFGDASGLHVATLAPSPKCARRSRSAPAWRERPARLGTAVTCRPDPSRRSRIRSCRTSIQLRGKSPVRHARGVWQHVPQSIPHHTRREARHRRRS
ncbi:MAG: hypothetical protein JWM95_2598 [Gemmatimonadetes bacterium]|nr:hypothetical protein [Gemmatimonadota bacterium]